VKAGKAYISSLGTTGLLIASSLLLLLVVGTILAFDRWPHDEPSQADVVAIGADRAVPARSVTAERRARARARVERRRAALVRRRLRARARATTASDGSSVVVPGSADPIISDLPAPDSDGSPGQAGGGSGGAGGGGGGQAGGHGGGSGRGSETTRQLGDAVSNVSPQAGTAIGDVGGALDQAIGGGPNSSLHP
jgi:uncharacterized membrane protein YgcG